MRLPPVAHVPAGPATEGQDAGRDVNVKTVQGTLGWRLLTLHSAVSFLFDQLQEEANLLLCQILGREQPPCHSEILSAFLCSAT